MDLGNQEANKLYARWLPAYVKRAAEVEGAIGDLFTKAFEQEKPGDLTKNQGVTTSLEYLKEQRKIFPHAIILFLYSSRYDQKTMDELLDQETVKAALPDDLTPREIFERKAARLDKNFTLFTLLADSLAYHYVLALMGGDDRPDLPLVWELPVKDEKETGYSPHAMWWINFQYACEVSRAIVDYGGFTDPHSNELIYIRGHQHLSRKLLWLDQDLNLFFPDNPDESWAPDEIGKVLNSLQP
ncbi:MAG: hypothetical protein ACXADH_05015 [Candidatus Kariarchaeaceae archaeon]|jgi:hypothetical protein